MSKKRRSAHVHLDEGSMRDIRGVESAAGKGYILMDSSGGIVLGYCVAENSTKARQCGQAMLEDHGCPCDNLWRSHFMCVRAYRCKTLDDLGLGWEVDASKMRSPRIKILRDRDLCGEGGNWHGTLFSREPGGWKRLGDELW